MVWNWQAIEAEAVQEVRDYVQENGPGIAGSVFLHGLGLALVLFIWARAGSQPQQTATLPLPVDIVELGDETAAPPTLQHSLVPQERAARVPVAPSETPRLSAISPSGKAPPEDAVEARLRRLAQLRQPDAVPSLENDAVADTDSTNGKTSGNAAYSLRDYIRAAVERRWSLDFAMLGKRDFKIAIHIEMTHNGKVIRAEIVDRKRYQTDAVFREIALSARNAVILSSPFTLPPGRYREVMNMVITFDPRDTRH